MTADSGSETELPETVVEEAERLTRLIREAVDDDEAEAYERERADLLAGHDYAARLRADDRGETLVLYPTEWEIDGDISVERVEDTGRAVEIPLDGTGDPDEWEHVESHNRTVAETVAEEYGEVHGANAHAFADFMSNHYARPVEAATDRMVREFVEEYFVRNAWPSEAQRELVEASVELVRETGRSV